MAKTWLSETHLVTATISNTLSIVTIAPLPLADMRLTDYEYCQLMVIRTRGSERLFWYRKSVDVVVREIEAAALATPNITPSSRQRSTNKDAA